MEFVKKETIYHYKLNQTEQISLVGLLSMILDGKEIKLDEESKELVCNLRDEFSKG